MIRRIFALTPLPCCRMRATNRTARITSRPRRLLLGVLGAADSPRHIDTSNAEGYHTIYVPLRDTPWFPP